jgi:hypothetical protein
VDAGGAQKGVHGGLDLSSQNKCHPLVLTSLGTSFDPFLDALMIDSLNYLGNHPSELKSYFVAVQITLANHFEEHFIGSRFTA